jgi:thiosulfate reductase cytochrome b subunit
VGVRISSSAHTKPASKRVLTFLSTAGTRGDKVSLDQSRYNFRQKLVHRAMQKSSNLYQNLGYWFLMFIVLVIAGFYTSYLSTLFDDKPRLVHIHFMLMSLWIIMLITQPFLIKYKKRAIHRKIGKASYVLVPLVLISGFLMMRQSFYFSSELIYQEAIKRDQI